MKATTLKNGMRVHLVPFTGTEAATVLVLTKVGSRYEDDKVWGGSHFIEHLMFKGTKKRPTTLDISKTLDRYGAQYNAYTGKDLTGYWVKIAGERVEIATELLHDMLFHSTFAAKEMKKEKQVIVEELKMYEENPIMHLEDLLEEAMFEGSTLGKDIGGTANSVLGMKRSDVLAFKDQHYVPSRMVIVVAGNVPKDIMKKLNATFGKVKKGQEPSSYTPFGETPERNTPRVRRQYKPLQQIQLGIGFPAYEKGHPDNEALMLLAQILGGGMSSRLFVEVRERKGLAYSVRAKAETYEDVGMLTIRAGLDAGRLELAAKTIIKELNKMKSKGVTPQELRMAKDGIEGSLKLSFENSSSRAEFFGRQELFEGKVRSLEDWMKKFASVKTSDIRRVANEIIHFKKMSVAAIGPYKTDKALLKHFPVLS